MFGTRGQKGDRVTTPNSKSASGKGQAMTKTTPVKTKSGDNEVMRPEVADSL